MPDYHHPVRSGDRCPGVLRPHLAADGALVRVRIPGGQTSAGALRSLARVATTYGNGILQLTSRASVQVRGLPDPLPAVVESDLQAAGFLPSASHERVRNIVASPLSGLSGGSADLRPLIDALDRGLWSDPELATLPGRFLFGLDDGRGDIAALKPDVCYLAATATDGVLLVGADHGLAVASADAVPAMLDVARAFRRASDRSVAWRVVDLPGFADRYPRQQPARTPASQPLGRAGKHAVVAVPLGFLSAEQAEVVAAAAADAVVITPSRGLVVPDAGDQLDALVAAGLAADDGSVWQRLTACVGAPWCTSSNGSTHQEARRLAADEKVPRRTHVSGCERRCGAPAGSYTDVVLAPTRHLERAAR